MLFFSFHRVTGITMKPRSPLQRVHRYQSSVPPFHPPGRNADPTPHMDRPPISHVERPPMRCVTAISVERRLGYKYRRSLPTEFSKIDTYRAAHSDIGG